MTRTSIREYLAAQRIRYRLASRAQRSRLLDEVGAITRYHRKAVIRLLRETPRARSPAWAQIWAQSGFYGEPR